MKKIKIAQIGIGHNHGAEKMQTLRELPDYFEIAGVAESDPYWFQQRHDLPVYEGLPFMTEEELLAIPGLDAAAIETDGKYLISTALRCAERGLHLHMDKPGGEDFARFCKLCDLCKEKDLAFQAAYIYRYNPALKFCMDAVKNGWIGDIFEIHSVMSRDDSDNDFYRQWLSQFKGGAFYIFAGYLMDIILLMLGAPDRVTSFLKKTRDDALIDNGLAVLEYPRATATVRVSVAEIEGFDYRRFIICGTEGSLELCPIEARGANYYTQPLNVRMTLKQKRGSYEPGTHTVNCGTLNGRYDRQLIEFARIINKEIINPFPIEHELLLHKTLLESCGVPVQK